jgi:hypothetical protein
MSKSTQTQIARLQQYANELYEVDGGEMRETYTDTDYAGAIAQHKTAKAAWDYHIQTWNSRKETQAVYDVQPAAPASTAVLLTFGAKVPAPQTTGAATHKSDTQGAWATVSKALVAAGSQGLTLAQLNAPFVASGQGKKGYPAYFVRRSWLAPVQPSKASEE